MKAVEEKHHESVEYVIDTMKGDQSEFLWAHKNIFRRKEKKEEKNKDTRVSDSEGSNEELGVGGLGEERPSVEKT